MWQSDIAYNELPALPPNEVDIESVDILKACITASRNLALLKESANSLPNPAILTNTLPLMEAQASSEIENIITTTDELFRYAANDNLNSLPPSVKEAFCYRRAMRLGVMKLKTYPICTNLAVELCGTLRGTQADIRKIPGCALRVQETGRTVYTPPVGEDVIRNKLSDWEKFMNGHTSLDPLIRMALGHYQFEAIHPFDDGNGRTGRILNILFLMQEGLIDEPVLFLSRNIISRKNEYYQLLNAVTSQGAWSPFVLFMIRAVDDTASWTYHRIRKIHQLLGETKQAMRAHLPKIYSHELLDLLFTWPYCRISNLVDSKLATRQTSAKYLKALVDANILSVTQQGNSTLFINKRLLALLLNEADTWEHF